MAIRMCSERSKLLVFSFTCLAMDALYGADRNYQTRTAARMLELPTLLLQPVMTWPKAGAPAGKHASVGPTRTICCDTTRDAVVQGIQ